MKESLTAASNTLGRERLVLMEAHKLIIRQPGGHSADNEPLEENSTSTAGSKAQSLSLINKENK